MTRPLILVPLAFVATIASLSLAAPASAEPAARAVAQCRAELLSRFDSGAIRSYRVASIAGNSRRTRVTFTVNADQRYSFECAADSLGQILVANLDPPRSGARLAAGQR